MEPHSNSPDIPGTYPHTPISSLCPHSQPFAIDSLENKPGLDFRGEDPHLESTDFSNLIEGAESMAHIIEPARNPEDAKAQLEAAIKGERLPNNDLTPPKKNNFIYPDESEGEDDFGYPDKDDYYGELGEGEIVVDDDSDYAAYGEGEGDDDGTNAIDQLKKVFLHMKGEGSSPDKSKESIKEDKKEPIHETPKKVKTNVKKSYREDEEKAPFTPLCEIIDPEVFNESDSSEDEGLPDYRIGGYHPVHVGEVFLDRYIIIQKLGWGHFSTVWLTKDLKFDTFVALKVQKSSQNYLEAAYDEVEILDVVSKRWQKDEWQGSLNRYYRTLHEEEKKTTKESDCYCVQLLNSFLHYGPNGKHFIMVFEIMGVNLLEVIKRYDYKGVPIPLVRTMARQ